MKIQNTQGLQQAIKTFENSQKKPDLVDSTVNQMAAQKSFDANAKSVKAVDKMLGAILDIKK